ncbi:hypothetical protein ACTPEM_24885, partial [Clostridioides difficile]
FSQMSEGSIKDLNIVIKADVQGSVQAVKQSLEKLSNEEVQVKDRFMGGIPEIEIVKIESIFRPYWVVFFGKVELNRRVSYLPIEA